jgi:hypothetical protein
MSLLFDRRAVCLVTAALLYVQTNIIIATEALLGAQSI